MKIVHVAKKKSEFIAKINISFKMHDGLQKSIYMLFGFVFFTFIVNMVNYALNQFLDVANVN